MIKGYQQSKIVSVTVKNFSNTLVTFADKWLMTSLWRDEFFHAVIFIKMTQPRRDPKWYSFTVLKYAPKYTDNFPQARLKSPFKLSLIKANVIWWQWKSNDEVPDSILIWPTKLNYK